MADPHPGRLFLAFSWGMRPLSRWAAAVCGTVVALRLCDADPSDTRPAPLDEPLPAKPLRMSAWALGRSLPSQCHGSPDRASGSGGWDSAAGMAGTTASLAEPPPPYLVG